MCEYDSCPECGFEHLDDSNYCRECGWYPKLGMGNDYTLDSELECQKIDSGFYDEDQD